MASGGSASINGILFQLLGSLTRALQLHSDGAKESEPPESVKLRIEPSGGGGDLQLLFSNRRVIEQWKARTGGGTWSLREILDDVLVDLYRAVDSECFSPTDEYRFVTEGRQGSWSNAAIFFEALTGDPPTEPLANLDDETKIEFFPNGSLTRRAFFLEIVEVVRRGARFRDEPPTLTHRKLWHLLGHFRIIEGLRAEQLAATIDELLRDIVERVEDASSTREQLCGWLMGLAGRGEVTFTPAELVSRAGLRARSFKAEGLLLSILRQRLENQIAISLDYRREGDVRMPPQIPQDCKAVVLSGESGQGKSWLLARLAHEEFAEGRLAVWTESRGDFERDLAGAAREIWQHGLDHDGELSLDRIVARHNSVLSQREYPWLTVCIDDVQTTEEARRLIAQDWSAWNARLALTVPSAIGQALRASDSKRGVLVIDVADFTIAELQSCLRQNGKNWAAIPTDVRETLRRPLLCRLYSQIAATADHEWKPITEYQLYERFWERVLHERSQAEHLNDVTLLGNLAANLVLESQPTYPWQLETILASGIDEATQKRLQAIGWLRISPSGVVEVWHDRLLNWAVAAGLIRRRKVGLLSTAGLIAAIKPLWTRFATHLYGRLRYVPADVLWLLSGEPIASTVRADVTALFAAKEDGTDGGYEIESFYQDLVPTLGERVIPFLVERLRVPRSERWNPFPLYIATALARIGNTDQAAVEARIPEILQDSLPEVQQAAVLLSTAFPLVSNLDLLWRIHAKNFAAREQEHADEARRGSTYEESFDALRRGVNADPNWLIEKIRAVSPAEPISTLAFLTAKLETANALSIWEQVREDLFRKMPPDDRRSLASCVLRFRDVRVVEQLEEWINSDHEWLAPTAFTALAATAPERALAALARVEPDKLLFYRHWWLPELMLQRPQEAQRALIEWASRSPEMLYQSLGLFGGYEHFLESAAVESLLDTLERATDRLRCATLERCPNYYRWGLSSIAKIANPDGLDCFASRAGSSLETKLTDIALRWLKNEPEFFADEIADLEIILMKIGGAGVQMLINAQLSQTSPSSHWTALRRAPILVDSETIGQLELFAAADELADSQPRPMPMDQAEALLWLSAVRRNAAVVQAVLRWGNDVVRDTLPSLRDASGPMTDDDLRPALEAFCSDNPVARRHAVCVFGLSGRSEHIPKVRDFLKAQPIGNDAALDAIFALTHLRDGSDESARLLEQHLLCDKYDYGRHVINALSVMDSSEAKDILERAFRSDVVGLRPYKWGVAARLCRDQERREKLLPFIWLKMKNAPDFWGSTVSDCYEFVAELSLPEVREFLWRKATPTRSNYDSLDQRAAAISALAKIDREPAFDAAESELSEPHRVESVPEILLRINAPRAVSVLCDQATGEVETAKRWQVGRALRLSQKDNEVSTVLSGQMDSHSSQERMSACELCGWMGVGFLGEKLRAAALEDGNDDVRRAARRSLRRQAREEIAKRLAAQLAKGDPRNQWSIALALVDQLDPYLLLRLTTPVSYQRVMASLPEAVILRVNAKLHERIRRLEDEAKKQDQETKSHFPHKR